MRVIERYGTGFRMLTGRGIWAVLYPARVVLAGIYGMFIAVRGRRRATRKKESIPSANGMRPIIVSIGNIEAGGGGKTPCAIAVARGIRERGGLAVVVTRGYRSTAQRRAPCIVPSGRVMLSGCGGRFVTDEDLMGSSGAGRGTIARAADVLGDEILLYRDCGIPVVIDPRRRRGADLARRVFAPSHILLDDAFQNFSVAKDVDILLLDAEEPFGTGKLLPLGTLRERQRGARRADIVIFTRACERRIPEAARRYVEGKHVYVAAHEPSGLIDRSGGSIPLEFLAGRDCVLFSGIARPESFERAIRSLDARPRAAFRFVDHHRYVREDIEIMLREGSSDTVFITTEKDRAKAIDLFPAGTAVLALRIEMRIDRLNDLLDILSGSCS